MMKLLSYAATLQKLTDFDAGGFDCLNRLFFDNLS